jgi:hypothetical protein
MRNRVTRGFGTLSMGLLLAGCTEYGFGDDKDPVTGDGEETSETTDTTDWTSSTDTGTTDFGACSGMQSPTEAVPLNLACDIPLQVGSFTPVVEWELPEYNGYGPPVAGQLDDDNGDGFINANDVVDIVFVPNNGTGVVSVNGQTGAVQWQSAPTDGLSGLAIGDLNGDGVPEIVVANGASRVVLLDNAGNQRWSTTIDNGPLDYFLYPSIADLDGDGLAEVIAGRVILDWVGNVLGTGAYGTGAVPNQGGSLDEGSVSVAVDLDGNGELEVVVGNAAYRMDGSALYTNGLADGCPAVADFDLDGEPEIVVVSGNRVFTLESDMQPTGWSATFAGTNYVGPPAADDLDGDGYPEFVVVGANEMRAYTWGGALLWTAPVQDLSGAAGAILFDFELDGYPEVVYADENYVRVFNGLDGSVKLESSDHSSYTGFETPIVADVDGDDEVEIVMLHGNGAYGMTVYGDLDHTWPRGRPVWNQHAYSITNVNDDLGLPAPQLPNWAEFNSFRSGDEGLPPSSWRDAVAEVVDVCLDECPDRLIMLVRVRNEGTEDIGAGLPLVVRAGRRGPVVASATFPSAIPSGYASEGLTLEVASADLRGEAPWVEVDRDGSGYEQLAECDEDNNLAQPTDRCP